MPFRRKSKKRCKVLCIILLVVVLVALIVSYLTFHFIYKKSDIGIPSLLMIPELSTQGYIQVNVDAGVIGNEGVITLTSGCYQLVANTEASQAESVFNGLEKKVDLRPNTHDLMKDALDSFGIEVVMVRIVELRNNTFIGDLVLKQGNKIVSLDSRPSDGIALAVRTSAPIFIKEDLMKAHGEYIC